MASVRDEVLRMLTEFPSLFTSKADCYRHLFLVNGNGYDWEGGELISIGSSKTGPDFKDEDDAVKEHGEKFGTMENYEKVFGHKEHDYIRLETRRNNIHIQFALDNIDMIMRSEMIMFGSSSTIHYSGWNYSLLMHVPEDVKPDWLEVVNEVRSALGPYIYGMRQVRQYITNGVDELEKDLKRLKTERFPEEFKRDAEMAELATELLAEMKIKDAKKD